MYLPSFPISNLTPHTHLPNRRYLGFEYWANPSQRDEGFITWQANGAKTARMSAAAMTADQGDGGSLVGDRLVPEEPMVRFVHFFVV